jgi:hypothetical protein
MKEAKTIMNLRKARAVHGWSRPLRDRMGAVRAVYEGLRHLRITDCCIPSWEGPQPVTKKKFLKGVGCHRILRRAYNNCSMIILPLLFLTTTLLHAQQRDTLSHLRDFVTINSSYKQMPLYLNMEMKNSTNFITGAEDTMTTRGEFFLRKENSYVHFGEFEQVVNDSLALLVSNGLQQMILYTNAAPIVKQMKNMMGMAFPDSSIRNLAAKYTAIAKEQSKQSGEITLRSRAVLYGTLLPNETIELQYDIQKKIPQLVTILKRSLLRLDSLQYKQLQNETALADKLLALEGSYFLIKEQVTAYVYNKIEQDTVAKVPVQISDRINKNEEGEYVPVKKYEAYRLSTND